MTLSRTFRFQLNLKDNRFRSAHVLLVRPITMVARGGPSPVIHLDLVHFMTSLSQRTLLSLGNQISDSYLYRKIVLHRQRQNHR